MTSGRPRNAKAWWRTALIMYSLCLVVQTDLVDCCRDLYIRRIAGHMANFSPMRCVSGYLAHTANDCNTRCGNEKVNMMRKGGWWEGVSVCYSKIGHFILSEMLYDREMTAWETCRTTALAHATLMDAMPPDAYWGMYTKRSQASRCRGDNPPPSLPNMKAVEVVKGWEVRDTALSRISIPTIVACFSV